MEKWYGAAGVCVNENDEILMVLQGKPEEIKKWSVPSGGVETGETFEECCIREIEEETGYVVEIVKPLQIKKSVYTDLHIAAEIHYFSVKVVGGARTIQDPDNLIYDIAWKSLEELDTLNFAFPEDKEFLINCIYDKELVRSVLS